MLDTMIVCLDVVGVIWYLKPAGLSMGKSNFLNRIEGFDGENFSTEILAYILETDDGVRKAFLDLLLKHRPDLRKAFRSYRIVTQQLFDFGKPDITITRASGRGDMVFVEVKTQAQEGDGQVKKYLKHGYVAYLTPRGHGEPDLDGANTQEYLGQFSWQEVYSVIQEHGSRNILHKEFLKYLEARHMGPLKPIRKGDLRECSRAAEVVRKFQALVDAVQEKIQPAWGREFGRNVGGKGATWGLASGELPNWWFRPRGWVKRGRHIYLALGVYTKKVAQDRPCFYVGLYTEQKKFGRELQESRELGKLCDNIGWRWDADEVPRYWGYYKAFPLGTGKIEDIAGKQISNILSVKTEIRKLVKFVEKNLQTP